MAACLLFPQRDITEYAGKDGAQVRSCSASFDTPREPVLKLAGVPQEMAERVEISRCIDAPYVGAVNKGLSNPGVAPQHQTRIFRCLSLVVLKELI